VSRLRARWRQLGHLARRFTGSLSSRSPDLTQEAWAESQLLPSEVDLWRRMANQDRRHAITVAHRFDARRSGAASRAGTAGALLHDVGKVDAGLGTFGRVVATVTPPRWRRGRYERYHRHEAIGAEWCQRAGSDPVTVALVAGAGGEPDLLAALRAADDI
jgi:hypothetical protein